MKKVILTMIAVFTATTTMVNAQDIRYGVRGGLNFAKIKVTVDDVTESSKRKTGFYLGGFLEGKMSTTNDKLYGEIGLDYSSQGGSNREDSKSKIAMDFFNLNTSLKYEVYKNTFIKGGLYLGYLVSLTEKYDGKSKDVDIDSAVFDFGIPLGAEYNLDNGMFFNLNYNIGFGLFDLEDGMPDDLAMKNRVIQLGLGYKF